MGTFFKAAAIGLAGAAFMASPVWAEPVYMASVDAYLSLDSVSISEGAGDLDFSVDGESFLVDADAFATGDATSGHSDTLSPSSPTPMEEAPVVIQIGADGSATGIGYADSFALGDSSVTIVNYSTTNTIQLNFLLDYSVIALAQVDDPLLQYATASTYFSVQNSQEFDPLLEYDLIADTDTPDTDFSFSDMVSFSLFVAPESEASLYLQSDVSGFLTSDLEAPPPPAEVPLPSMAALFALSALGMCLKSRRSKLTSAR